MNIDVENRQEMANLLETIPEDFLGTFVRERYSQEAAVTFLKASRVTVDRFSIRGIGGDGCQVRLIWLMGGRAATNSEGETTINLNQLLCLRHDEESEDWVPTITNEPYFVATARSLLPLALKT